MASTCCTTLQNDLAAIDAKVRAYTSPVVPEYPMWYPLSGYWEFFHLLAFIYPAFSKVPETTTYEPNIGAMLQGMETPLDIGMGQWSYYNYDEPGKTVLNLPQSPVKYRADLNGVRLSTPRDYSITGNVLTMTQALEIGDFLTVNSYGE